MRICLISAPTANDFDDPEIAETDAIRMIAEHAPLGILSLAAVLEQEGIVPDIVDLNRLYYEWLRSDDDRQRKIDFCSFAARHLQSTSFDIFGFSTICSSYPLTLRIAREVRRSHPRACIMLGGPQASVVDVKTMEVYPFVDFILRGEAEQTLPALLRQLADVDAHAALPGLTYRRGEQVVRNANASVIEDLDSLPLPAFHLYPYMQACEYIPLELGRGCPFACRFCSTNDFFRRRFRLKSPAHVIGEMKRLKEAYGVDTFDLVHDMFTVDRKRVVAFCEALLDCGEKFFWGCSARTDCIDDKLIALMAKAGCRGIFFGIETGSERLQKVIHKRLDLAEAAERIRCTDRYRIKTAVSLITGFPEETIADLKDTVHFFFDSLRYDYADPQLCLLAPLAETPILTEHRDNLIFDDIISDMSFQGWQQDPDDRKMIAAYPDIFPNFYSVPTPFLDRSLLKELREFVLNGMTRFRWLLIALHQDSGDLLEVFTAWREWRAENHGRFSGGNPTVYYAGPEFHGEFLEFVRGTYLPGKPRAAHALSALVEYEAAFDPADPANAIDGDDGDAETFADFGGLIGPDVTPLPARNVKVTRLCADYKAIVERLRKKRSLDRIPARAVTLVTRDSSEQRTEILQLSAHSAELLAMCDGESTVGEIAERFATLGTDIGDVPAATACIWGLELLRRQRLVVLRDPAQGRHTDRVAATALAAD